MAHRKFVEAAVLAVLIGLGMFTVALATEGKDTATEKKISKKDVPAAVLSAFQNSYPNAKINGVSLEKQDSITFYEIESKDGKVKRNLLYSAEGTVKEVEEIIKSAELPDAVKQTISKEYLKGKLKKEAEKITKDGVISYEVVVKNDEDKYEIVLSADGTIVKKDKIAVEEKD
jgi:hypothetical protein